MHEKVGACDTAIDACRQASRAHECPLLPLKENGSGHSQCTFENGKQPFLCVRDIFT